MIYYAPICEPPNCFIGSYPPVTPAGQLGPYYVNTYLLAPDRRAELCGSSIINVNPQCIKRNGVFYIKNESN